MLTVIEIIGVEERRKGNEIYYRTHALLEDGEIAIGYGNKFEVGDKVMRFYDPAHDTIKMRKPIDNS